MFSKSEKQYSLEIPILLRLTKAPPGLHIWDIVLRKLCLGTVAASFSAQFSRPGLAAGSELSKGTNEICCHFPLVDPQGWAHPSPGTRGLMNLKNLSKRTAKDRTLVLIRMSASSAVSYSPREGSEEGRDQEKR